MGPLQTSVVEDIEGLRPWLDQWDALAVLMQRPFCAPGWMLAWWRNVAPKDARLRVVVVADGDRLVGIAPYFVSRKGLRHDYRLLGSGSSHRIAPLADPRRKAEVATAVVGALAASRPRPDLITLEGTDAELAWHELLRHAPGRDRLAPRYTTSVHSAPVVSLGGGGFESWLATRSKNFRKQTRRARRRLEDAGAELRLATSPAEAERAGAALLEFHRSRFGGRGGSNLPGSTPRLLRDAAELLPKAGRLRVLLVESGDRIVAVEVLLAAGGMVSSWNAGFDPAWAGMSPSVVALTAAIEDSCAAGDERVDLGAGGSDYKWRLADRDEPISWGGVMPLGPRLPLTYASMIPSRVRYSLKRMVQRMPEWVETLARRVYRVRAPAVAVGCALVVLGFLE